MTINTATGEWQAVEGLARDIERNALERLIKTGLSLADTEFERGRLAVVRDILALADAPKPRAVVVSAGDYGLQGYHDIEPTT